MINNNNIQQLTGSNLSASISDDTPKYGFDIDAIEGTNPKFKCIFCHLIIREPIQLTECGHRSCRECVDIRIAASTDGNITCPIDECHLITNKTQIMPDKAFSRELNVLRIGCLYRKYEECPWTGMLQDYQKHLEDKHIHYNCVACNQSFSSKLTLDEHLKKCPEIFDQCRLGVLCTEDLIPKNEFLKHLQSEKHQETVIKFVKGEYHVIESSNNPQPDNQFNKQLEEKISQKLNNVSEQFENLQIKTRKLNDSFENIYQNFTKTAQELNNSHISSNERLSIKQSIQPFQEKLQKEIGEIHEICNKTEHISTDGTLTWRIENISEKMADAQTERQTSIFSPIFYSSPTGYRMRARLFLFGDGSARRTHISLFFLLMKGDYDSILKWPFHYKVTFCLLDQTGNNRHIIDSFYPDVKSNSFQRPRDVANTASGIPKFFPLPMLLQDDNAYVRENTLYIKIIIALNDTPKSLLPFMLTLNPALPNYVQENLINQESAKQQQQQQQQASNS